MRRVCLSAPVVQFCITFVIYLTVGLVLFARFGTSYDLVIFHQAVAAMAEGRAPVSELKGAHVFGDHFHPVILVLVPLMKVFPTVVTLLVAQAAALGLAAAILQRTWREVHGDRAWWLPLLWSLSPGIMAAASYDFHEVTLGAPLVAMACRHFVREQYWATFAWSLSVLLVKENAFVLVLGLAVALACRRRWLPAGLLAGIALAYGAVVMMIVIPRFNNESQYTYGRALDVSAVVEALVANLLWPGLATVTAVGLLALAGFAALRSPLVLAAAAWWGSHLIMDNFRYQFPGFHYHVLPAVVLGFAAVVPIGRLQGDRMVLRLITAWCLVCVMLGPATWRLAFTWDHRPDAAQAVVNMLPRGASVAADPKLVGHLSNRSTQVSALHPPYLVNGVGRKVRPQYVLIDRRTREYGGGWTEDFVATQLVGTYVLVDTRDGYQVYVRA